MTRPDGDHDSQFPNLGSVSGSRPSSEVSRIAGELFPQTAQRQVDRLVIDRGVAGGIARSRAVPRVDIRPPVQQQLDRRMGSGLHRMRLYQGAYGLTELRLYTMAFMLWLGVVFGWFAWTVLRGHRERFAWGALTTALGSGRSPHGRGATRRRRGVSS